VDWRRRLGAPLRALRGARQLTQEHLAGRVGVGAHARRNQGAGALDFGGRVDAVPLLVAFNPGLGRMGVPAPRPVRFVMHGKGRACCTLVGAGGGSDPVSERLDSDQASIGERHRGSRGGLSGMGREAGARRSARLGTVGGNGVELAELLGQVLDAAADERDVVGSREIVPGPRRRAALRSPG